MVEVLTEQTGYTVQFNAPRELLEETAVTGITLTESLLTPTLQTTLAIQDVIHTLPKKNLDQYKNIDFEISIERLVNQTFNTLHTMKVRQKIFRLENRQNYSPSIENFYLQGCDPSLLSNAAKRVSKSWECKTPSVIVTDILQQCLEVKNINIEESGPPRTYFAENIRPFQAIAQQADTALSKGEDPSFLHFMTYDNFGTHHFRSLSEMTKQDIAYEFIYSERGTSPSLYSDPHQIITYEFPCDFDYLSDILNAEGEKASLFVINPFNGARSMIGNQDTGCGMGGAYAAESFTDKGSSDKCELNIEKYALLRQARMGLLDQDKLALRMTVPWNPELHAGKMIRVTFPNRPSSENYENMPPDQQKDYGSGDYLIVTMTHTLNSGGFAVTVLDCVAKTVGEGVV
jgi:hypothetical protein